MGVSLCEFESRSGHQKTAGRARLDSRASLEALLARRGHMEFAAFRSRTIFHALLAWYGPQGWWPGGGPFETIVGAILTQNTSWRSVEQALGGLRDSGALAGPESLDRLAPEVLERLIRPAGFRRQKAATLKRLVARASREPGGLTGFLSAGDADLRRRLLEIKGIGPETADSIMLYAAGRPVFVVDAYTRRLVARHGLMSAEAPYDHVQQMFARAPPVGACDERVPRAHRSSGQDAVPPGTPLLGLSASMGPSRRTALRAIATRTPHHSALPALYC